MRRGIKPLLGLGRRNEMNEYVGVHESECRDEYIVIDRNDIPSLERAVNRMIELGWEPCGSMSNRWYPTAGVGSFFQPMTKIPNFIRKEENQNGQ